jgi:hypothetical protein
MRDYDADSQRLRESAALVPRYYYARARRRVSATNAATAAVYTPIYQHVGFIWYLCTTLGLTTQSLLSLLNAEIPPTDMPSMSFAEWQSAGVIQDDILLLLDLIFADTPPCCAACKMRLSELCPHSAFSGTPRLQYNNGDADSYVRVAAPGYCFSLEVHTRPSSCKSDWSVFVDGYYVAVMDVKIQASSELAADLWSAVVHSESVMFVSEELAEKVTQSRAPMPEPHPSPTRRSS